MKCLSLETHDPFFNLSADEYLLKNREEDFLILGCNDRSMIIGKHQVANREADAGFVSENNIPVIRRISGGGTVFHDRGNLNFTFIRNSEPGKQIDFRRHTLPVIRFLSSLGVEAKFEGKNDLKVKGLKISGNAEHVYRNRVLHHGTLLYDTLLEDLRRSINRNRACYTTRAVGSNPSPVTNLKDHISSVEGLPGLKSAMMEYFLQNDPDAEIYRLQPGELAAISELATSKYRTWEWNYAYGPEYQFVNTFKLKGIPHTCRLSVRNGIIEESEIEGSELMSDVAKRLAGCRHMVDELGKAFHENGIILDNNEIYNFF
ncbi:MAG: lipoate--protein ligase family protein [Bacteroidales bacterium]|nr:lipoate--protein ligase family protein [Bacteroidales bacterium]